MEQHLGKNVAHVVSVIVIEILPLLLSSSPSHFALVSVIVTWESLSFCLIVAMAFVGLAIASHFATCHKAAVSFSATFWSLFPFCYCMFLLFSCRSICYHLKLIWLHLRIPKVFCQQQIWVFASFQLTLCNNVRLFALNCQKLLQAPIFQLVVPILFLCVWCVCVCMCVVLATNRLGISAAQKTLHFGIDFAYT